MSTTFTRSGESQPLTAQPAVAAPQFSRTFCSSDRYTEHQHTEVHEFSVVDATHGDRYRHEYSGRGCNRIWVGIYGEGRWLRPEQVLELACALENVANAHIERLSPTRALANQEGGAA